MSFRDFKEEIYLVLQIRGGYGFGFATSPLIVTANFVNHVHESFITEPSPNPKFENEFVWVMDKSRMKSIWSDKAPVKVDCYYVNQSHRTRLGYIILNVKDAQIIHDESKITEKQVRLLGVSREVSLLKPELILAFYISDVPINSPQLTPQFSPPLEGGLARMAEEPIHVTLGSGKDNFSFTIKVAAVNNLSELLPSHSEVEPELLTYTYSLLGAEIMSTAATSHSARLSITSSLACLKTYFVQQPTVPVKLQMGSLTVGNALIDIQNLLLSDEAALMRKSRHQSKTAVCRCSITPMHNLSETLPSADARPGVDFSVSLGWETPGVMLKKRSEVKLVGPPNNMGAGGDADRGQCAVPLQAPTTLPLSSQSHAPVTPRAVDTGGSTYRANLPTSTLTVSVTVASISLPSLPANCWFRLTHETASVLPTHPLPLTRDAVVQWQISLSLPRHLLESTLASQPPCLQLGTSSDNQLFAFSTLHPPDNITNSGECTATVEREEEKIGEVVVVWAIVEAPSESATTLTDSSLSPPTRTQSKTTYGGDVPLTPRTRELKMLSFVEELEDWAEKKRIMVLEGLKQEELSRRAELQRQLEEEASRQVSEGGQLVETLHSMRSQLLQRETELRDKEHKLKVYKEELERVHRIKLQEFKDLSHRMQDEFNHKLGLIAADKVALEKEVEQLRDQNLKLRHALRETETVADVDKRALEPLKHELKVIQEKLQVEQESKKFFKEHCRKAEQEIYRLNLLRQQEMEARLHTEKTSLEQLAFQQLIVERKDFRQDQRQLEEIRRQLLGGADNGDANSGLNREAVGRSPADERHIRRAT